MAAIGAVIVAGAVAIVLAVRFVVLLVVAEQVLQRESVVDGNVVDAGARLAAVVVEDIRGAGHAFADVPDQACFARPETPQRAAILVVPFRPLRGKRTDLIAAKANVPRFGNELDRGEDGILSYGGEEAAAAIETVGATRQRGGEIEAESIDVADLDPVAQRIHHHLQDARMRQVEGISGSGEVVVEAWAVRCEPIIGRVVDAAKRQRRAEMVAFGGVIVDHIEQHFDPGVVQPRDCGAEGVERIVLAVA